MLRPDPGLRRKVGPDGKDEHVYRLVLLPRLGSIDGRAMEDLVAVGGNIDETARALERGVALVAHDLDDRLAAAPLVGRGRRRVASA